MRKNTARLLGLPVLAGAAFAVATGAFAASDDTTTTSTARAEAPPALSTVSATTLRDFKVFRTAAAKAKADGPNYGASLPRIPTRLAVAPGVVGAATGRRPLPTVATKFQDGRAVYASADESAVCVYWKDAVGTANENLGGGCDRADEATQLGVFNSRIINGSEADIAGLVPDGVGSVTFTFKKLGDLTVPVSNNSYVTHTDALPTSWSFTLASGETVKETLFTQDSVE